MCQKHIAVLAGILIVIVSGCGPGKVSGVQTRGLSWTMFSDDPMPGLQNGSLNIFTLKYGPPEGLQVAVWSDCSTGSTHASAGGGLAIADGVFDRLDGTNVKYHCETTDGVTAKVTIAGAAYSSEKGALFLISTQSAKTVVKQLNIDTNTLPNDATNIEHFAQVHPEIAEFFTNAKFARKDDQLSIDQSDATNVK